MTIAALAKVTLVGLGADKELVLEELQRLGMLHLIPLTADGAPAPQRGGPSREAREALKFLLSCPRPRQAVKSSAEFDAADVERRALDVKRRTLLLEQERDFLVQRIADLEPWGDFQHAPLDQLAGQRLWFYAVPRHRMAAVAASGLVQEVVHRDERFDYVCVLSRDEPAVDAMPVLRTHTGSRPLSELQRRLEQVEAELEDRGAERERLTRWRGLFARALDGLEDAAARAAAGRGTFDEHGLCALQAWAPSDRLAELEAFAQQRALALVVRKPEPDEQPPTLLANPPALRAGEDLVAFYQTPGYWLWDPSSIVFVSFALFFGMIVADLGYGAVMAAGVALTWRRLGHSESGRRWRVLLAWLAAATMIYGALVGSTFGVAPGNSVLRHLHVLDFGDAAAMMKLSIVVGASHVVLANLLDARRWGRRPERWVPIGWALVVGGATAAWLAYMVEQDTAAWTGGAVATFGLLLAMVFAGAGKGPLGRVVAALAVLPGLSGAFGDVMSYLRLFALGLASASLAAAFNDMAADAQRAIPGAGFLCALLVLLIGHALNLTLAIASGFIHGLRLNVIEFFKHGIKAEGFAFRPFQNKETT